MQAPRSIRLIGKTSLVSHRPRRCINSTTFRPPVGLESRYRRAVKSGEIDNAMELLSPQAFLASFARSKKRGVAIATPRSKRISQSIDI
jgi:hypothetical protein